MLNYILLHSVCFWFISLAHAATRRLEENVELPTAMQQSLDFGKDFADAIGAWLSHWYIVEGSVIMISPYLFCRGLPEILSEIKAPLTVLTDC